MTASTERVGQRDLLGGSGERDHSGGGGFQLGSHARVGLYRYHVKSGF